MPANIDSFVGRQPAWHRLGIVVDHALTPQEARKLAFDWEPEPVTLINGQTFEPVTSHKAIVRSDNQQQLGIVGETYGILGNDVITELAQATGLNVSTAGALGVGERVWMLLEAEQDTKSFGGDEHHRYIWICTSHDGSGSLTARPTNVRVVCQNTWQLALSRSGRKEVNIRHTSNAMNYVAEAKRVLAKSTESFDAMDAEITRLLMGRDHGDVSGLMKVVVHTFGERPTEEGRAQTTWDNRFDSMLEIYRSETIENIRGTDFGSVMTINEWELRAPGRGDRKHEAEARRILSGLKYTAKATELVTA